MAKYSRTAKYEELRNRIQNDTDTKIGTGGKDLSTYEDKLNRIDAGNFKAPQEYTAADHDPIHQRRTQGYEAPSKAEAVPAEEKPAVREPSFDPSILGTSGFSGMLDNEYLDEYINEVKRYNKDQGIAFSTNTRMNILHDLKKDKEEPEIVNVKPFRDKEPVKQEEDTTELPPIFARKEKKEPVSAEAEPTNPYGFDLPNFPFIEDRNEPVASTVSRTKEDIAAEVKNLMQNQYQPQPAKEDTRTVNYDYQLEEERTARQQLLNETTQMRAQLDTYEDNLEEVNDRVQRTNQVLNGVLIVLIIVLFVMLAVVMYWILNSKGVL